MNKLDLSQTLIIVADTGSIQAAAKRLHQTSAAISRKISKLESYLGIKLIDRQRTGAVLTEIGQHYYYQCKQALEQFQKAEAFVKKSLKEPSGELTVVANEFYATYWILPQLAQFIARYPKIRLSLKVAEVVPDFKNKKMDILFGVSFPGSDNLIRKRIDQFRYVLCASASYLKKNGQPKSLSELLQHQFIAHSSRESTTNIILDKQQRIIINPTILIDHSNTIITAALQDLGIIWVPESFVSSKLKNKELIEIFQSYNTEYHDVYIYYPYHPIIQPEINAFVRFFSNNENY